MNSELEHRIIQYLTNSTSSIERANFEQDLDSDGQLMNEFIAFKSVWDLTESLSYESSDSDIHWSNFESLIMDKPNASSSKLSVVRIAASILIIAVSSILMWTFLAKDNKVVATDFSKNYQFDDQSNVIINPNSSIVISNDYNVSNREITLYGEAFFDVVPDDKKFIVHTNFGDVVVHGTKFKVSVDESDSSLLIDLFDGQLSYISNNSEYKLVSGDLLTSSKNVIEKLRSDISINGNDFVTCKNTSLADILSQINLVYGVNHNIKSKLLNDNYTISFPKNDINKCIAILKQVSGYNFTFIDNSIVLK
ncbi:MAG: FecR family protein [Bacteroidia bacterium]|nr:FecR family protein [Bacteroidia bacterium]